MKIFISGNTSGRESQARREYASAKKIIESRGHDAVNPFENGLRDSDPWEQHLAAHIISLMQCDALYLLPDWEKSRDAALMNVIARCTGKKIFTYDDDITHDIWLP